MIKNFIIGLLILAVVAFGSALVRVENERYALSLGMCPGPVAGMSPDMACVSKTETRTGWWWHIYAALTN